MSGTASDRSARGAVGPYATTLFCCAMLSAGWACGGSKPTTQAPPPVGVEIVEVKAEDVPIFSDYVGETYAREQVEVRGRVTGYIEKRLFEPGSEVKKGQVLYVLDRRPYEAEVLKSKAGVARSNADLAFAKDQVELIEAQAQLAEAEANLIRAKNDVDRLGPLVEQQAAPKQDLDNAVQNQAAMQATYDARKANVDQKRLSTKVRIDAATAARLEAYDWPGNVRELKNLVERSLILGYFPPDALPEEETAPASAAALDAVEKSHILEVLAACGGNKSEAARRLGVSRKTVERKLAQWGAQ